MASILAALLQIHFLLKDLGKQLRVPQVPRPLHPRGNLHGVPGSWLLLGLHLDVGSCLGLNRRMEDLSHSLHFSVYSTSQINEK